MLAIRKRNSGRGANQIGNLQRSRATRWSSHYESIKSLIDMYAATCKVFEYLSDHSPNGISKVEVRGVYKNMASFEFVFILHLMHKIMRISDTLCQILQKKISRHLDCYYICFHYQNSHSKIERMLLRRISSRSEFFARKKILTCPT